MQKSKSNENISTSSESSDKALISGKNLQNVEFTDLIKDLTELNSEGIALMKESKLEEAKEKFFEGNEKFEKVADKVYNLFTNNDKTDKILSLYKTLLSKTAQCFFEQKKYKESIEFDLKLICLEPKDAKAIYRLFNSYSRINKCQQSVYYGDVFLELDTKDQNNFKNAKNEIEKEKRKLVHIQSRHYWLNIIKFNFILFLFVFIVAKLFFVKNKMK